jgi:hypothetical protein
MATGTSTPSNFPNGFLGGVTIRGVPLTVSNPGKVLWVGNSSVPGPGCAASSDSNPGTFTKPFSTLAGALASSQLQASRGDIIVIKPGHAESVTAAAGIVLSVAGVTIVGLGTGSMRPTFTFTTANTASITVTAVNVGISNCLFIGGFLNVATCFSIANAQVATDFAIDSCEFRDSSAILNFVACVKIGTTANIADGFQFTNNRVLGQASSPAAATTAVVTASDINRAVLKDNFVSHQVLLASTACLLATGATNVSNSIISGNKTDRPNTTSNGELFSTSGTSWLGTMVADNYCGTLSANGLVAPISTKAQFVNNYCMITGAADKSALVNPAAV